MIPKTPLQLQKRQQEHNFTTNSFGTSIHFSTNTIHPEALPNLTRRMEPDAKRRRVRDPRENVEQRFPMSQRLKQACAGAIDEMPCLSHHGRK